VVCLPRASETDEPDGRPPSLEVADIFRTYGELYRQKHWMTPEQLQVFRDILACRTAVLGGHLDVCPDCGFERPAYNSCRNRHCPKCQAMRQAAWIEGRMARTLPCPYFHVVFTLPAELRPVARRSPRLVYNLLFEAASQTLLDLGDDPKRLGAQLGFTAVLHTWTRTLEYHPHLHCVVTGGGLSRDGSRWIPIRRSKYLFPVRVLGDLFRGKFLAGLRRLHHEGQLDLAAIVPHVHGLFDRLYAAPWVVYAKRPFGGPEQVYRYLGRYTHRIAISNQRLVSADERDVTFRTKNGKTVTVAGDEFIRRFLLHVLPKRFVRLRHYGLMAPANAATRLEQARALLAEPAAQDAVAPAAPADKTWVDRIIELTGTDPTVCPQCRAKLVRRCLPAVRIPRAVPSHPNPSAWLDSS
jgi:predicted Zn-ribbon and HTH transcriptional regulator